MVTIKDIAAYTGVSATTISNVIHGRSGRVSAETVAQVQDAIQKLGYTPNMSARSLVSRSSKVVAFINHVVTRPDANPLSDPFLSAATGLIERKLREQGYYLMLRTVKTPEDLREFTRNWNVDGMFFTGIFEDAFFEAVRACKVPVVLIDSYVEAPSVCKVGLDDYRGAQLATRHLIARGHKTIGFATPDLREGGVLWQRFSGYRDAMQEAGLRTDETLQFLYEMDSVASCHAAAKAIAQAHGTQGLTGVVATADQLAIGILSGLNGLGLRVPEDISLVGFDDLPQAELAIPPLTTIHQDMSKKLHLAVEYMLDQLEGEAPAGRSVSLPVELVERESVRTIG